MAQRLISTVEQQTNEEEPTATAPQTFASCDQVLLIESKRNYSLAETPASGFTTTAQQGGKVLTMNTKSKHVVEITRYPTYNLISTHTVRLGKTIVSYHRTARAAINNAGTLNNIWNTGRKISECYTAHVDNQIVKH